MANPQSVGYGAVYLNYGLASQEVANNRSLINWNVQLGNDGSLSGTSSSYSWNFQFPSGTVIASGSGGSIASANSPVVGSGSFYVGHDANGNCPLITMGAYFSWYNGSGTAYASYTAPRIPLAPPIVGLTADTIGPTSARLGIEIGSFGHGTVAAMYPQYRLQGDTAWNVFGAQNDVVGYNYFLAGGLKPGKTYEYMAYAYNNNGDTSNTGIQTFKTKGIPGAIAVLGGFM